MLLGPVTYLALVDDLERGPSYSQRKVTGRRVATASCNFGTWGRCSACYSLTPAILARHDHHGGEPSACLNNGEPEKTTLFGKPSHEDHASSSFLFEHLESHLVLSINTTICGLLALHGVGSIVVYVATLTCQQKHTATQHCC